MIKIHKDYLLKKVCLIKTKTFKDKRGSFVETYNKKNFNKLLKEFKFIEDDLSISKKNVFRGFHSDNKAWKLLSCIHGEVTFFFLDSKKNSKNFFNLKKTKVSDRNICSFLIPPNIGIAYYVASKKAIVSYKQTQYYDINRQNTVSLFNKKIRKKIKLKNIIISDRDKKTRIK